MLLEFPVGSVTLDKKELCHDLTVIAKLDTLQGRAKFYDPEGNQVDIIVQGCTKPKIANMGTVISTIYGIEGIKNIPFKFQIEYKIFKEIFILNGNVGSKSVSIQDKSLIHLVLETIKHTCQK